jgi:hypothetical protein
MQKERRLTLQQLLFIAGAAAGALGVHRFAIIVLVMPLALLMALAFGRAW